MLTIGFSFSKPPNTIMLNALVLFISMAASIALMQYTLISVLVVPVLYDILFRREVKKVEIGDEELLDEK